MTDRTGTNEPGGADEVAAARDALDGVHGPLDGSGASAAMPGDASGQEPGGA